MNIDNNINNAGTNFSKCSMKLSPLCTRHQQYRFSYLNTNTNTKNSLRSISIPIPILGCGPRAIPIPIPILGFDSRPIPIPIPILAKTPIPQYQYQYFLLILLNRNVHIHAQFNKNGKTSQIIQLFVKLDTHNLTFSFNFVQWNGYWY